MLKLLILTLLGGFLYFLNAYGLLDTIEADLLTLISLLGF